MFPCRNSELCAIAVQGAVLVCLLAAWVVLMTGAHRLSREQVAVGINAVGIGIGLVVALAAERWRRRDHHGRGTRDR